MAEPDQKLETFIAVYKDAVDRKYNPIVGRLTRRLVHSNREEETELDNLVADAVYNDSQRRLESLDLKDQPVTDQGEYIICVREYHHKNSLESLNLTPEEVATTFELATSDQDVLEEYLSAHQLLDSGVEGRLVFKKG